MENRVIQSAVEWLFILWADKHNRRSECDEWTFLLLYVSDKPPCPGPAAHCICLVIRATAGTWENKQAYLVQMHIPHLSHFQMHVFDAVICGTFAWQSNTKVKTLILNCIKIKTKSFNLLQAVSQPPFSPPTNVKNPIQASPNWFTNWTTTSLKPQNEYLWKAPTHS